MKVGDGDGFFFLSIEERKGDLDEVIELHNWVY